MAPIEIYKKHIKWVPFRRARVCKWFQLLLHCCGSISQMNSTEKSGSHSIGNNFYKLVLWKIKKLTMWVPFPRARSFKWIPIPMGGIFIGGSYGKL